MRQAALSLHRALSSTHSVYLSHVHIHIDSLKLSVPNCNCKLRVQHEVKKVRPSVANSQNSIAYLALFQSYKISTILHLGS